MCVYKYIFLHVQPARRVPDCVIVDCKEIFSFCMLYNFHSNLPLFVYHRKYTVIDSPEQRQRYKNDFNSEYSEYRGLHARIEGITRQFTVLDNELKQLQPGTDKYKVDQPNGPQQI